MVDLHREFVRYPNGKIGKGEWCDVCKRYNTRRVTVTTIGIKEEKVLMALRARNPEKDKWSLPGGYLDWDETALGYNAWSLIRTGKDEYGQKWPLVFRSFDDYKPPLYFYLLIPIIKIFGLTDWAVRLPSALFGSLAVIAVYFLVKELFGKKSLLPLIATFLFAISPWHLYFCRIGFEAKVGLSLNIIANIVCSLC